ncbi:hypothetical protein [Stenotrophomonas maltophilia]|uniref:hypothetical protein n=1 Tax=Stenotrophomonas maltophilia TaxID=40324 RepID=UPI001F533D6F|nr:hypothetical protein [Stenotrophomonas maltophilia]MCI1124782.1 hypothetical protein [Stenotrophomonas maltophilia]
MSKNNKASVDEALIQLYHCINGPRTSGRKWVTYSREQVEAMLDVTKQILEARGAEFREAIE